MFSFARENEVSLTNYFHASLTARNVFVETSEGSKWAADEVVHTQLSEMYAPVLGMSTTKLHGIHAQAFMFDRWVVKTNLFGQYYQDGQRQWLEWCVQHQNNPLVPKVAFLVSDAASDRFLVVMEKLVCHSGFHHHMFREQIDTVFKQSFDDQPDKSFPLMSSALVGIKKNSKLAVVELIADIELMQEIGDADVEQELKVNLLEHEIALEYIDQIEHFWLKLLTVQNTSFAEIRAFWATLTAKLHEIDVHSLNWMLRENGEQVLLDPVN